MSDPPEAVPVGKALLFFLGGAAGPFITMGLYVYFSRSFGLLDSPGADTAALVMSLALGLYCVLRSPAELSVRVLVALLYVPLLGFLLVAYSFIFVGTMTGEWP